MPDAISLAGKTVLVTGASSGVGWATALAFSARGANVVVTARREQRLRDLCDLIGANGGKAVYLAGDAAVEVTAQRCVALAVKQFGRLDILINNAGQGNYKNLVDTSAEEYDALMDSNMKSSFLFARYAAPLMIEQKGGEILFISSVAGLQGYAGEAVYCASKFALEGMTEALALEAERFGGQGTHRRGRKEFLHDGAVRGRGCDCLRLHAAPQRPHPADDGPSHGRARAVIVLNHPG